MCRFVAYLGKKETSLASLVLDPEHSLLAQSYAPREMLSGVVNADGFGAAFYAPNVDEKAALYRSLSPIWSDETFRSIAPKIRSRTILAALRNATPPLPSELSAVPPFASGRYSFVHNGAVEGFRGSVMRPLRRTLSDERYREIVGASDSETIFACVLDLLDAGANLPEALGRVILLLEKVCRKHATRATLNLALTDGKELAFARYSTEGPQNSLYVVEDAKAFPEAVVVASERLDGDALWREVPPGSLLYVNRKQNVEIRQVRKVPK